MPFVPRLLLVAVVVGLCIAAPMTAAAAESAAQHRAPDVRAAEGDDHDSGGGDVEGPVLWSIVGIAAGVVVMGGLYLLKRGVGGFPKNPTWVAPISIEPSSTFLDETKMGELPADSHGAHH